MRKSFLLAAVVPCLAACSSGNPDDTAATTSATRFDSTDVAIVTATDTIRLRAEIANTDDERGIGLMDRDRLDENSGMLFVYDAAQDSTLGFYMFRTRIPLDIAFADSLGVIRAILQMTPCERVQPAYCEVYRPGVPYNTALEVNHGFFARHGITTGARIVWPH
jgi:uncharacterized membrane protein (UPF0127 family)